MKICKICESGKMVTKKKNRNIKYLGVKGVINFYYSECSDCSCESQSKWQVQVNKDNMIYFHRMVDKK